MGRFSKLLLAVDFDRTLTDRFSRIPQRNLDAIRAFEQEGGAFTVATGRSVPMFQARQASIPTNAPLVLYNGGAFYDYETKTLTDAVWMPRGRELLLDMQERFPMLLAEVQGTDYHYLLGECPLREAFYRSNEAPARAATMDELPERFMKVALFGSFRDETVRQFFEASAEEAALFEQAVDYLNETYGEDLVVDRSALRIIDLQARSVSKGKTVRRLADKLGRPVLVCAGDAPNDQSMLELADLAFVPGDGHESLKSREFRVVCPCDDGAVADAIEALFKLF